MSPKRKLSKSGYMFHKTLKSEQRYKKYEEAMQMQKRKDTQMNHKIMVGCIFFLLPLITVMIIAVLLLKNTTMSLSVHLSPAVFFVCMFTGWILFAGIFCFHTYSRNKRGKRKLYGRANTFTIAANIFIYSAWFALLLFSPFTYVLPRLAVATIVLIIMIHSSRYLLHHIWRCPACHKPLPTSRPGYRVLVGAAVDCTSCPHCGGSIE